MSKYEEVYLLYQKCEEYELEGREILDRFALEELAKEYNGAGPDSWIPEAREILTKAMALFKPAVLIHDMQFAQSDGTDEGFAETVAIWHANTKKILAAEYPFWTWKIFRPSYRITRAYWIGVMEAANLAICTPAARRAWKSAHERKGSNHE